MKILLDMNLAPEWRTPLEAKGHVVLHWADVGSPNAPDREIMKWAADAGFIVFTHDLDFSAILSATQGTAPSVLQMRTQAPTPAVMAGAVIRTLVQFEQQLRDGAIVVIDESRSRVRVLPLKS